MPYFPRFHIRSKFLVHLNTCPDFDARQKSIYAKAVICQGLMEICQPKVSKNIIATSVAIFNQPIQLDIPFANVPRTARIQISIFDLHDKTDSKNSIVPKPLANFSYQVFSFEVWLNSGINSAEALLYTNIKSKQQKEAQFESAVDDESKSDE